MNSQQLFLELLHRIGNYSNACVLYALLQQGSDEMECTTSIPKLSQTILGGRISRRKMQQVVAHLSYEGLIEMSAQPNYRTSIKINREAVDALLRKPLIPNLPGMGNDDNFPYLEHYAAVAA